MKLSQFASLISLATVASALTPAEWRSQSIYQVVTDRFALTDGSTTAECDISLGRHCGGTWQGIINKLDYIQGMGFTAVRSMLSYLDSVSLLTRIVDLDLSSRKEL